MTELDDTGVIIEDMAGQLQELLARTGRSAPAMVGIHTGGVWIARQLHALLAIGEPLGSLDISFYRDDFTRIGMNPVVQPSQLPFSLDNRHIILVDDVLHTGRTIRAALNELFDYGRPASIMLATLRRPRVADPGQCRRPPRRPATQGAHQAHGTVSAAPGNQVHGMSTQGLQIDAQGRLRHFLSISGLNRQLLTEILDTAESFTGVTERTVKKVPLLRGKTIVNLFFEASTRTRTTFELAAKRLSADVLNINITQSSAVKGETLLDTLRNLEAMHVDMFVVRHADSGAAHFIAAHVAPHVSVINAGDGSHAHPTQAMLDMFTIRRVKGPDFGRLRVAIVGDILHSRVARSQIHALNLLNTGEVRIVAPRTLMPVHAESLGARIYHDLRTGIHDVDVIIMLRLQRERMQGALLPSEHEYYELFGLTEEKLAYASPDVTVMHPGPINRGVEMDSEVADGPRSVILEQVTHGIAVRMAVMSMAMARRQERDG